MSRSKLNGFLHLSNGHSLNSSTGNEEEEDELFTTNLSSGGGRRTPTISGVEGISCRGGDTKGLMGGHSATGDPEETMASSSAPHTTPIKPNSVSAGGRGRGGGGGSAGDMLHYEQEQGLEGTAVSASTMENTDPNPYSSDEWEESDISESESDDCDSSDDDDPKSQVDRLIERGTLMYMEGENSNLSSDSSDLDSSDYDFDDSDSESDITDVSPLISATASPLGLSPILPRRILGTSPLALHDNRDIEIGYRKMLESNTTCLSNGLGNYDDSHAPENGDSDARIPHHEPTDMSRLLEAVVELEKSQGHEQCKDRHGGTACNGLTSSRRLNAQQHNSSNSQSDSTSIPINAIHSNPHHRHLRKCNRRKNLSFTNEEVRRIDRENQILLRKIVVAHHRNNRNSHSHHSSSSSSSSSYHGSSRPVHKPANATINRKREDEKIRRENLILLRKIQGAKPSREVIQSRPPRVRYTLGGSRPSSGIHGSCSASARTAVGSTHVTPPHARKETAL